MMKVEQMAVDQMIVTSEHPAAEVIPIKPPEEPIDPIAAREAEVAAMAEEDSVTEAPAAVDEKTVTLAPKAKPVPMSKRVK